MQIAQRLFQGVEIGNGEIEGLITYHRTDSTTLSDKALSESARVIGEMFGTRIPRRPAAVSDKVKNAQEAHEAIRPSDFRQTPQKLAALLEPDELRLYDLIWKRTMASQMKDARVLKTTVEITAAGEASRRSSPRRARRSSLPGSVAPTSRAATTRRPSSRIRRRSCRRAPSATASMRRA